MASRKKNARKFGIASGRHRRRRKALGFGRKFYRFSCQFKDSDTNNVVIIKRTHGGKKRNKKLKKTQALKKFYQLYRSDVKGQLRKRYVRRYFSTPANGYRFINLGSLQQHVSDISLHSATCKKALELGMKGISPIELVSEVDTFGLASVLATRCKGCHREILLNTSPKLNIDKSSRHFDINVRAVWGTLVTGNGQAHLNEFLATADSPGLTQNTFSKIESDINHWWNEVLQDELRKAVEEEKQIAISKESFHEGISRSYGQIPTHMLHMNMEYIFQGSR